MYDLTFCLTSQIRHAQNSNLSLFSSYNITGKVSKATKFKILPVYLMTALAQ